MEIALPLLGIIMPCYNEAVIIENSHGVISKKLQELKQKNSIAPDSFLVYVDDGSTDTTFSCLMRIQQHDTHIRLIKLSRNFGHQYALLAGMENFYDKADALITLDVDLQDDVDVIDQMIDKYKQGAQLVYGVRKARQTDSWFKRTTALGFYRLMHSMGVEVVYNHSDYRLIAKQVLAQLLRFEETNLFLRGIFPSLGFQTDTVYYDRKVRIGGESKYPFYKMASFAIDGITSFSVRPLRLVSVAGGIIFIISIGLGAYAIAGYLFYNAVPGWTSIVLPIYLLGGIQLLGIGILGEYIGKIYKEVKRRPRYIIEKLL